MQQPEPANGPEGMTVCVGRYSRLTTPVQTAHVSILLPVCMRTITQFLQHSIQIGDHN